MQFCRVAIDSPVFALDRPFDYAIPERMAGRVQVGSVVRVVLHGRNVRAYVTELLASAAVANPRPLSSLVSPVPVFTEEVVGLARWAARRYVVPLGRVLRDAVPGRFSLPAGEPGVTAVPRAAPERPSDPGALAPEVAGAIRDRGRVWWSPRDAAGETAGLVSAVLLARSLGRPSLVICPRVEQVESLAAAVGGAAVLHGQERPAARAAAWAAAMEGRADVVMGGRSALFVPVPNLGLVAVASAHDRALKSERAPRLHGLQVARRRAEAAGAAFVVSSPAPPVDLMGEGGLTGPEAARAMVRPEVVRPRKGPMTPRLVEMVSWALSQGRDALVFVARKGGALRLRCRDCGWVPECDACGSGAVPAAGELVCRVCGRHTRAPEECSECRGRLDARGWGHQRLARALEAEGVGPVVEIVRGATVEDRPHPAVVVGTLAAAHAVGSAGCVCVADLDQMLARPDFRASEYALQTLYDLAWVMEPQGRFLVQTRQPDHYVVQAFTRGSYRYFLRHELPFRHETGYPPYGTVVRVEAPMGALEDLGAAIGRRARTLIAPTKGRRGTALVRSKDLEAVLDDLHALARSGVRARIDVDPVDVL